MDTLLDIPKTKGYNKNGYCDLSFLRFGGCMPEDTRELVITEARRMFFLYGFRRITMDEIASNLRMSKKTLYAIFAAKDELVRAVVVSIAEPRLTQIERLTRETKTVADFLGGTIEVFRTLSCDISEPMMTDMRMSPELWKDVEARRLVALSHIEDVIKRGKRTGEVRQDLNVDLFLRIFMQIISSIGNPATLLDLNMKPSELAEQIFVLLFHGIVPAQPSTGGVS